MASSGAASGQRCHSAAAIAMATRPKQIGSSQRSAAARCPWLVEGSQGSTLSWPGRCARRRLLIPNDRVVRADLSCAGLKFAAGSALPTPARRTVFSIVVLRGDCRSATTLGRRVDASAGSGPQQAAVGLAFAQAGGRVGHARCGQGSSTSMARSRRRWRGPATRAARPPGRWPAPGAGAAAATARPALRRGAASPSPRPGRAAVRRLRPRRRRRGARARPRPAPAGADSSASSEASNPVLCGAPGTQCEAFGSSSCALAISWSAMASALIWNLPSRIAWAMRSTFSLSKSARLASAPFSAAWLDSCHPRAGLGRRHRLGRGLALRGRRGGCGMDVDGTDLHGELLVCRPGGSSADPGLRQTAPEGPICRACAGYRPHLAAT